MHLHVSRNNDKIGQTPNVSLPPGESCLPGVPCLEGCYARSFYRMYPQTLVAWDDNLKLWSIDPKAFEEQLNGALYVLHPERFRWHVGGDIPDYEYSKMMVRVAVRFPNTKFLVYTRTNFISDLPNLVSVRSHWLGDTSYSPFQPHAYVMEVPKIPVPYEHAFICPGSCKPCGYKCWDLKNGDLVVFKYRPRGGTRAKKD